MVGSVKLWQLDVSNDPLPGKGRLREPRIQKEGTCLRVRALANTLPIASYCSQGLCLFLWRRHQPQQLQKDQGLEAKLRLRVEKTFEMCQCVPWNALDGVSMSKIE